MNKWVQISSRNDKQLQAVYDIEEALYQTQIKQTSAWVSRNISKLEYPCQRKDMTLYTLYAIIWPITDALITLEQKSQSRNEKKDWGLFWWIKHHVF